MKDRIQKDIKDVRRFFRDFPLISVTAPLILSMLLYHTVTDPVLVSIAGVFISYPYLSVTDPDTCYSCRCLLSLDSSGSNRKPTWELLLVTVLDTVYKPCYLLPVLVQSLWGSLR